MAAAPLPVHTAAVRGLRSAGGGHLARHEPPHVLSVGRSVRCHPSGTPVAAAVSCHLPTPPRPSPLLTCSARPGAPVHGELAGTACCAKPHPLCAPHTHTHTHTHRHTHTHPAHPPSPTKPPKFTIPAPLQVSSMYHVDTGFTNEAVPLNDEVRPGSSALGHARTAGFAAEPPAGLSVRAVPVPHSDHAGRRCTARHGEARPLKAFLLPSASGARQQVSAPGGGAVCGPAHYFPCCCASCSQRVRVLCNQLLPVHFFCLQLYFVPLWVRLIVRTLYVIVVSTVLQLPLYWHPGLWWALAKPAKNTCSRQPAQRAPRGECCGTR